MAEKRKAYLIMECQLRNIEGIMDIEKKNPYLAKIIAITVSDKNNQWRLILVGRNTKDLVTNFTVGKPSQCHLNSVVKVCITRHRTN